MFNRDMVLGAIQRYEDKSTKNLTQVCHFLEAFQMSPQAWCICSDLLWELDEHEVNVLFLCGTMLRHKIREQIKTISGQQQLQLRDTLFEQLKRACKSQRPGINAIVRLLALIIADMGLRMPYWTLIVSDCINELWLCAPNSLIHIIQLLPEQSSGSDDMQQLQRLRSQGNVVIQMLTDFQKRTDIDIIDRWRGCLLTYGAWANWALLPLNRLMGHSVLLQAITLLKHPHSTFESHLYGEACQCIIGLISCVTRQPFQSEENMMYAVRQTIYDTFTTLPFNFRKLSLWEMHECTQLINKLTDTYAGLDICQGTAALLRSGPRCFELQLMVVEHCDVGTVLTSMYLWQKLADELLARVELELYELYQPLVRRFFIALFPLCRLPAPDPQPPDSLMDVLINFRSQVSELLLKFADLLDLKMFLGYQLNIIRSPQSNESDIEMTLFFISPLIKVLYIRFPHLIEELMISLPPLYEYGTVYSVQLISCLVNYLIVMNKPHMCYDFVQHLSVICSNCNQPELVAAATEAYGLLELNYTNLAIFKPLFNDLRLALNLD